MLTFSGAKQRFCDGITRREFLTVGALGLGGLTLADLLRLRGAGAGRNSSKAVIMVWLGGGPSQLDMYDLKPEAPAEFRGEFKPIRTNVPGFDLCEHLPLQAQIADRLAVVRSLSYPRSEQSRPQPEFQRLPRSPPAARLRLGRQPFSQAPRGIACLSMSAWCLATGNSLSWRNRITPAPLTSRFAWKMGKSTASTCRVGSRRTRLADRKQLIASFDNLRRDLETRGDLAAMDTFQTRALDMIASPRALEAFDLGREPDKVRERYGRPDTFRIGEIRTTWQAEKLLLARRLVEAGVSVVSVSMGGEWDHHGPLTSGGNIFGALRAYLPRLDRSLTVLLSDLRSAGWSGTWRWSSGAKWAARRESTKAPAAGTGRNRASFSLPAAV